MRSLIFPIISATAVRALYLNVTAIAAANNESTLECWQMDAPFWSPTNPSATGLAMTFIGEADSIMFGVAPPGLDSGLENAASNQ